MKRIAVLLIILILVFGGLFFWWNQGLRPVNSADTTQTIFVVKKGSGVREIANDLKTQGLIRDPIVFFLRIKQLGIDNKIEAGDFRISPNMSTTDIAQALTHGTLDIWVTIPEGKRADEIADILKSSVPTYNESWREELNANEGYLFPDTYLIPRDATIQTVINQMRSNFEQKYQTLQIPANEKLTKQEIVILASMIEREARDAHDRPLIASVMLNRLDLGMALQIDATIQYALGYQTDGKTWWKKVLTVDDLALNSNYNTYKQPGLPPTPISNPGLSVLEAVVHPADTPYLFYMTDKNGITHYAKTNEEHNANIKKYGL